MLERKTIIERLERDYLYSRVGGGNILVPQSLVLAVLETLKKDEGRLITREEWNPPRVYSKDEIKPGIFGWMDCPNWIDFVELCEIKLIREETDNGYINSRYDNKLVAVYGHFQACKIMEAYNKSNDDGWRLWNKKPTKEQRQAWPWEGKPTKGIEYCFKNCNWTYYEV